MGLENLISFFGILGLLLVAWAFSSSHKTINVRVILWGLGLQLLLGIFVFLSTQGRFLFQKLNDLVFTFLQFAIDGAAFVFGKLAYPETMGFILAFQSLPVVIFFAALMGLLYYSGIMPWIVRGFSWLFTRTMKISGAESLSVASNIFVGIESAFVVRPYYNRMTQSELATVLAGCMATIASTVLGLYALMLRDYFPSIAGHLISASLLSAPAVIVIAKLMVPETEVPATLGQVVEGEYERPGHWVEAIYINVMEGAKLAVGIGAMLIALIGLLKACNAGLAWLGLLFGVKGVNLETILGYVFYPLVLLIGVSFDDAQKVSTLLGLRVVATEFPAYAKLASFIADGSISARSAVITTYALCGFAHIPSIAIFVGGIAALAPKRTKDLGALSFRALVIATLACMMTGAVAGVFYTGQSMILKPASIQQKSSQPSHTAPRSSIPTPNTSPKPTPRQPKSMVLPALQRTTPPQSGASKTKTWPTSQPSPRR